MITLRPSSERGRTETSWLKSYHTFSFGEYQDEEHVAFRSLRVINEDFVDPGEGFPPHPHRDMEIITYLLAGSLEHKDSLGNGSVIRPGEVQRMSAGTGVVHSEFNPSPTESVHLLQIWIFPSKKGLPAGYEQKSFSKEQRANRLCLLASSDGRDGSVRMNQDALLFSSILDKDAQVEYPVKKGRGAWLQVAKGSVDLNGNPLEAGDGASVDGETTLKLKGLLPSEILLFDLA